MNIRPLSPELAEKARVELNEDPKRISSDIQHIKEWLSKQSHLKTSTDDQWLVAFLRSSKYSLERTKEKLDLFYTLRTVAPELFALKYNDPIFDNFFKLGVYVVLPETVNPEGPRTIMIRSGVYNPEKYSVAQLNSIMTLIQKILLFDDDKCVICGTQWVMDLKDVTMGHFLEMTPTIMKKMVVLFQDASPTRMKGAHFVNAPPIFEKLLSTMKILLNEKNKNRLHVYKNYEELYKNIPKTILPKEYGGNAASIKDITDYWIAKKNEYSSWLEQDDKCGTDESKRPGQPKTTEGLFGTEGSFRQLDFD